MKKLEALNNSKSPIAVYDKKLDKYENMPLFQKKVDKANAILANNPPYQIIRDIEDNRIKTFFEQGLSSEQIAANMSLSESEIMLRLTEMGLVEKVNS